MIINAVLETDIATDALSGTLNEIISSNIIREIQPISNGENLPVTGGKKFLRLIKAEGDDIVVQNGVNVRDMNNGVWSISETDPYYYRAYVFLPDSYANDNTCKVDVSSGVAATNHSHKNLVQGWHIVEGAMPDSGNTKIEIAATNIKVAWVEIYRTLLIRTLSEYVDAERDLGCIPKTLNSTYDNAPILNAFFQDTVNHPRCIRFQAKPYLINDTITTRNKSGLRIEAAGGSVEARTEPGFHPGGFGGDVARLICGSGVAGKPAVKLDGNGCYWDGLQIQGLFRESGTITELKQYAADNINLMPSAGILIAASSTGIGTGEHNFPNLTVIMCERMVQFAEEWDDNHADNTWFGRLQGWLNPIGVDITNRNSVALHFDWFYPSGSAVGFRFGSDDLSDDGAIAGLYVGTFAMVGNNFPQYVESFDGTIYFYIRSVNIGDGTIYSPRTIVDGIIDDFYLVYMTDNNKERNLSVKIGGQITPGGGVPTVTDMALLRGNSHLMFDNFNMGSPGTIETHSEGANHRNPVVTVRGCKMNGGSPENMIKTASSDGQATVLWYGCMDYKTGEVFTDGRTNYAKDETEIGAWNLQDDAASGVIAAQTGSDGTLASGNTDAATTTGPGGSYPKALDLSSNSISLNDLSVSFSDQITVSIWTNFATAQTDPVIFSSFANSKGFELRLDGTTGKPRWMVTRDDGANLLITSTGDSIADGQWHHIVGLFEASVERDYLYMYVDGELEPASGETFQPGEMLFEPSTDFTIGARPAGTQDADADFAGVKLFNKVITQSQITDLFAEGS